MNQLKMENFFTHIHFIILFATTSTFIIFSDCSSAATAAAHIIKPDEINPIFVFGDSLYDVGNNNYINTTTRANFYPYGESFFKKPTGRFSNGRLIPDFIAEFAKQPLVQSFLGNSQHRQLNYGVNFASAGAGALIETHAGKTIGLKTQLSNFNNIEKELKLKIGNKKAKQLVSESVYLFSVGGNDFIRISPVFSTYQPDHYVSIVIGNITQVIQELHKKGARNFGFLSLIPLNYLPFVRAQTKTDAKYVEGLKIYTNLFNAAFAQRLKDLENKLKGFHYSNFAPSITINDIIDNPSKYGFKEVKSACCGSGLFRGADTCGGMRGVKEYELCKNPDDHLFFDAFHLSEKYYRIIARLMWNGVRNVTSPYNLKSYFKFISMKSY